MDKSKILKSLLKLHKIEMENGDYSAASVTKTMIEMTILDVNLDELNKLRDAKGL